MPATFSTPRRDASRLSVRDALKSLASAATMAAAALAAMAALLALFALRFGVYAATHGGLLAALHLPGHAL